MSEINLEQVHEKRQLWSTTRAVMEAGNFKHKPSGKKSKSRWPLFVRILRYFKFLFKITGLYRQGYKNTFSFSVHEHHVYFDNLPEAFDGYRILYMSDLHLDTIPGYEQAIIDRIKDLNADLCLLGGDYRMSSSGSLKTIIGPMKKIAAVIKASDGAYAVLGNHDTGLMAEKEDEIGISLLLNEHVEITRGDQKITITGTDDPFRYYTDQALYALENSAQGFKIALIHTSELSEQAAENGYDFYMCGHTHGGQICLPGGQPLVTHQNEGREFIRGFWEVNGMKGYTTSGAGVSGLPVRFFCPGEVVLFHLGKK